MAAFVSWGIAFGSGLCRRMAARRVALQLFGQNRDTKVASLHSLHHAKLQDFHDFVHRCTSLERVLDVALCADFC